MPGAAIEMGMARGIYSLEGPIGRWLRLAVLLAAFVVGAWGYLEHYREDVPWWHWGVPLIAGCALLALVFPPSPHPSEIPLRRWLRRCVGLLAVPVLVLAVYLAGQPGRELSAGVATVLGLAAFLAGRWVPFSSTDVACLLGGGNAQQAAVRGRIAAGVLALIAVLVAATAAYANRTRHLTAFLLWLASLVLYAAAMWCLRPPPSSASAGTWLQQGGPPLSRRTEAVVVLLILAVGGALRLPLLERVPALINSDEGRLGRHAERLWQAGFPDAFELGWNAFPNLSFFAHYLWVQILGTGIAPLRLSAVTFGLLTLLATHFWVRRWWGNVIGALAMLALTINHEHVYWSRIGLNNMQQVFVAAFMLATFARALQRRGMLDWVWFGYASGLSLHVYHGAKLFPLLLAGVAVLFAVGIRGLFRRCAAGAFVGAVAFLLMLGPHLVTLYERWDYLYANTSNRVDLHVLEEAHARGDTHAVRSHLRSHVAGTLFAFTKEPYKLPVLDPFLCVPFLLGLGWMFWQWRDPRHLVVLAWIGGIVVIGGMITAYPPNNPRLIGVLPAVCLIPAVVAGRARALLLRGFGARADVVFAGVLMLWVGASLYHNWQTEFVYRAGRQGRDMMTTMCQVMERTPLPATFYMAGGAGVITPRIAPIDCMLPAEPERYPIDLSDDAAVVPIRPTNRGHAVLFFTEAQAELLPLVRHYYPGARYEVLNNIDERPVMHWFTLTPREIQEAQGLAVAWSPPMTGPAPVAGVEVVEPPADAAFPVRAIGRGQLWISPPGEYAFRARGASLEIDDDNVAAGQAVSLAAGWHTVVVAASFGAPGSSVRIEWLRPGESEWTPIPRAHLHPHPQTHGLLGRYFARELPLEGAAPLEEIPDYTKIDTVLSFDWSEGADEPPPPVFAQRPSTMEWVGTIDLPAGVLQAVRLDSAMPARVYVDGQEVVATEGGLPTRAVERVFRARPGPVPIVVRTVRAADARAWLWKLRVLWRGPGGGWMAFVDYRPPRGGEDTGGLTSGPG